MGFYINPSNGQDQLEFLKENGRQITREEFLKPVEKDMIRVCLLNNLAFWAAGLAYCQREAEVFADLNDGRPKFFFVIPKKGLEAHVNLPQSIIDSWI